MRRASLAILLLLAAIPSAASAGEIRHIGSATSAVAIGIRPPGGGGGPIAQKCSGPNVPVFVYKNGHRERWCKCRPGAVGQLIENGTTHAKELRCLMPAGPRPR